MMSRISFGRRSYMNALSDVKFVKLKDLFGFKNMAIDNELQLLAQKWLDWDKNDKTRREINELLKSGNSEALRSRLCGKLAFGTAGVRCKMGAGFACLNDLTIIQLSHGMAKHLLNTLNGHECRGIVVGFDGRHNSKRFADLAANVFIRNKIKVFLFSDVVPTPVVSFATIKLNCNAGLIITASHNPKEDNGYKAYWGNGAQIIEPHDVEICRIVQSEPEPKAEYWDFATIRNSPLFNLADCVLEEYYKSESKLCYHKEINMKSPLKFTYSAFHGVGSKFFHRLFTEFGFPEENLFHVKEQDNPDPNFPTVVFPNPEEGLKVLKLCIETADQSNSSIILANDPDADRIQLAEKQKDGQWRVFTGNEMGAILTWWIWTNWHAANPDADLSNIYILNSAVSSQIVKTIADTEGFCNQTTLTGFKWMGNVADDLKAQGKTTILSWEESIGFMPGHTLDKDGISSAAIFAEIANYLFVSKNGFLLSDQLFEIYYKYGFHLVRSSYWIVTGPSVTKQIFADLRTNYPKHLGTDLVKYVRDLTTGYDNSQPDEKAILPLSSSSEMITFTLENGSVVTIRASGTEPKIKYYIELKTEPGKRQIDLADILKALDDLENNVVETLLQPIYYGLERRST